VKTIGYILVFIMFTFINANQLFGQEEVSISTGFGLPEALNIGIRYQIHDQAKIGLSVGWWENDISLSGDYYYHFGGSSKFSDIRPWYVRIGLNYVLDWWTGSYLRVGRDFNLGKSFGISIDAGLMYNFTYRKHGLHPFITVYGVSLFYRI